MDETNLTGFLWMAVEADEPTAMADKLVALLRLACDGDIAAFEAVVRRTERQVFFTARRLLGNTEDAQDAAQEVFVRAYRFLNRLSDARQFRSWLSGKETVRLNNMVLAIEVVSFSKDSPTPIQPKNLRISTDVDIQPGQQIVVGKATLADRAFILVISAATN